MAELTEILTELGELAAPGAADPIAAAELKRRCRSQAEWLLRSARLPTRVVCPRCQTRLWQPHPYCQHEAHALLSAQPAQESQSPLRFNA